MTVALAHDFNVLLSVKTLNGGCDLKVQQRYGQHWDKTTWI